jgi:ABC-2 type transport system permease protein
MQIPARLVPASWVFESMRRIVAGQPVSPTDLGIGLGLAVLYVIAMGFLFTRIYAYVVRSGLIARYSAESIT